eukprot:CAMPEP_0171091752 /NCGR_PEP_ID=MMETSP0766_2-20121228/35272_1 /TAXON_ID=439317 /ORGANISM="Gambierdiscus australes, Strain CAWD 149" /LENGTH=129 /DNA_ID=CAMNT_0011549909 /DNA_START=72 /DNA_END=461 /DNA_ORIENTATION=+
MASACIGHISLQLSCALFIIAAFLSLGNDRVGDQEAMIQTKVSKDLADHSKKGIAEGCPLLYECLVQNCSHQAEHCLRVPNCANGWFHCLINHCGCYDWHCHSLCLPLNPTPLSIEEPIELCAIAKCMR